MEMDNNNSLGRITDDLVSVLKKEDADYELLSSFKKAIYQYMGSQPTLEMARKKLILIKHMSANMCRRNPNYYFGVGTHDISKGLLEKVEEAMGITRKGLYIDHIVGDESDDVRVKVPPKKGFKPWIKKAVNSLIHGKIVEIKEAEETPKIADRVERTVKVNESDIMPPMKSSPSLANGREKLKKKLSMADQSLRSRPIPAIKDPNANAPIESVADLSEPPTLPENWNKKNRSKQTNVQDNYGADFVDSPDDHTLINKNPLAFAKIVDSIQEEIDNQSSVNENIRSARRETPPPLPVSNNANSIADANVDEDKKPVDAGKKPVDEDKKPVDAGKKPVDAGKKPVDVGKKPVDEDKKSDTQPMYRLPDSAKKTSAPANSSEIPGGVVEMENKMRIKLLEAKNASYEKQIKNMQIQLDNLSARFKLFGMRINKLQEEVSSVDKKASVLLSQVEMIKKKDVSEDLRTALDRIEEIKDKIESAEQSSSLIKDVNARLNALEEEVVHLADKSYHIIDIEERLLKFEDNSSEIRALKNDVMDLENLARSNAEKINFINNDISDMRDKMSSIQLLAKDVSELKEFSEQMAYSVEGFKSKIDKVVSITASAVDMKGDVEILKSQVKEISDDLENIQFDTHFDNVTDNGDSEIISLAERVGHLEELVANISAEQANKLIDEVTEPLSPEPTSKPGEMIEESQSVFANVPEGFESRKKVDTEATDTSEVSSEFDASAGHLDKEIADSSEDAEAKADEEDEQNMDEEISAHDKKDITKEMDIAVHAKDKLDAVVSGPDVDEDEIGSEQLNAEEFQHAAPLSTKDEKTIALPEDELEEIAKGDIGNFEFSESSISAAESLEEKVSIDQMIEEMTDEEEDEEVGILCDEIDKELEASRDKDYDGVLDGYEPNELLDRKPTIDMPIEVYDKIVQETLPSQTKEARTSAPDPVSEAVASRAARTTEKLTVSGLSEKLEREVQYIFHSRWHDEKESKRLAGAIINLGSRKGRLKEKHIIDLILKENVKFVSLEKLHSRSAQIIDLANRISEMQGTNNDKSVGVIRMLGRRISGKLFGRSKKTLH